jgi:exocyst complex component 4
MTRLATDSNTIVQTVAYENEPLLSDSGRSPRSQSSPIDSAARTSRLSRFLNDLALRPNDPPHDLEEPNLGKVFSRSSGLSSGPPPPSFTNLTSHSASISSQRNPESDSFAYMELLLESLAVLGKLGTALDAIAQRLPTEIFTLVESTVGEVAERAEYGRRSSMVFSVTSNGTVEAGGIFVLAPEESTRDVDMLGGQAPSLSAARLRLGALESSSKQADHETLREFFWTIYSKLDAVTQGFRVIYEVANRIGSVSRPSTPRLHNHNMAAEG